MTDNDPQTNGTGFQYVLGKIDDGSIVERATEELQKLCQQLKDHSDTYRTEAKGSLTLTINLAVEDGMVDLQAQINAKAPKPKAAKTLFYLTKSGGLSVNNPKQQELPLRAVPAGPAPREAAPAPQPAQV